MLSDECGARRGAEDEEVKGTEERGRSGAVSGRGEVKEWWRVRMGEEMEMQRLGI